MIICATAIVIANGLVQVFAQIRTENNIISGNSSLLVKEGIDSWPPRQLYWSHIIL